MPRHRRIGLQRGRDAAARRQGQTQAPGAPGGKSQGPAHGQGLGLGLYLLTTGSPPGAAGGHGQPVFDPYYLTVIADAPLAYWRLSEQSGTTVVDASGNNVNGTYVNSPTLKQAGIPGAVGNNAAKFDPANGIIAGQQQYAHFGDVLPLTGTKLSIEFWLRALTTVATAAFAPYIARGDVTWRVNTTNTTGVDTLQFAVGSGSTPSVSATGLGFSDGNWHHVVCVYDQTNLIVYKDGGSVASKAWSTDVPAAAGKDVGISWNSDQTGRWVHAIMDEVAIYNTALSAGRVLAHYNAGIA